MALIYSPIQDVDISDLGVDVKTHPECPKAFITRANVNIYFSMLIALIYGRRDMIPIVWAWARTAAELHLRAWRPEDQSRIYSSPDLDWVIDFCQKLQDTCIDFKIPASLSDSGSDVSVNIPYIISLAIRFARDNRSSISLGSDGDDTLLYIITLMDLSEHDRKLIHLVSLQCMAGSLIGSTGWTTSAMVDELGDNDISSSVISAAETSLSSLIGPEVAHLPAKAMRAFQNMRDYNDSKMEVVWGACVKSMMNGYEPVELEDEPLYQDAFSRSQRWRKGNISDGLKRIRDACSNRTWEESVDNVLSEMSSGDPYRDVDDYLYKSYKLARDLEHNNLYQPMSFMSMEDYEWMMQNGKVRLREDISEEELMAFSDDPAYINRVASSRLWGELARNITTAFYVRVDDEDQIAALKKMCGEVVVEWDREVLGYSTLSLNDSMLSKFCLPASRDNREKFMAVLSASQVGSMTSKNPGFIPALAKSVAGSPCWVNYVELQIHESLTPKLISNVEIPNAVR